MLCFYFTDLHYAVWDQQFRWNQIQPLELQENVENGLIYKHYYDLKENKTKSITIAISLLDNNE
jgi:hypothetical protein